MAVEFLPRRMALTVASLTVIVFEPDACAVLVSDVADCSLKYSQNSLSVPLVQATVMCPPFEWFLGHKGTPRNTEGDKKQAVFIDVFYFVQENRKVRSGPEANALIH
jgi:hypothetical protein